MNWELDAARNAEGGVSMADQIGLWEQDERERIQEERERPCGLNHVDDGGGDAQRLE
jgi:hypothetical protein